MDPTVHATPKIRMFEPPGSSPKKREATQFGEMRNVGDSALVRSDYAANCIAREIASQSRVAFFGFGVRWSRSPRAAKRSTR